MTARKKAAPHRTAFHKEGNRIFQAQRAAERLMARAQTERNAVMSLSRDELSALAAQMLDVATVAASYHLEKASAGSLTESPEPVV